MQLSSRIDADLKSALKESDKLRLSVLRLLKSSLKYLQIEKARELTDDEVVSVINSLAKQRRESIAQFSSGGREDLAEQERSELSILQSYLPEQLSAEALESMILQAVSEAEASSEKDMGAVMRILMPRIKGLADGKAVNNRVREILLSSGGKP